MKRLKLPLLEQYARLDSLPLQIVVNSLIHETACDYFESLLSVYDSFESQEEVPLAMSVSVVHL